MKLEFNIILVFKIGSIAAMIISKVFTKFITIKKYYQAYQKGYNNITHQFANKNRNPDQIKHYEVFLQCALLDKLPKVYAPFISAIDKD